MRPQQVAEGAATRLRHVCRCYLPSASIRVVMDIIGYIEMTMNVCFATGS